RPPRGHLAQCSCGSRSNRTWLARCDRSAPLSCTSLVSRALLCFLPDAVPIFSGHFDDRPTFQRRCDLVVHSGANDLEMPLASKDFADIFAGGGKSFFSNLFFDPRFEGQGQGNVHCATHHVILSYTVSLAILCHSQAIET